MTHPEDSPASCPIPSEPDLASLTVVELEPDERVPDYRVAMSIANAEAEKRIGQSMLLSWYDRRRNTPVSATRIVRYPAMWITAFTTVQP